MATEKVYAAGIRTFAKNEKAPSFVLGTIVITFEELGAWIKGEGKEYLTEYQGKKQLRLQVLDGKDRLTIQVDTFKPSKKEEKVEEPSDDLPFILTIPLVATFAYQVLSMALSAV
jgi:hypothetical protein